MSEFITAGGPFMWPLLACSVLIITISIERSWFLQNRLVSPKGLSNQIIQLLNNYRKIIYGYRLNICHCKIRKYKQY